MTAEQRAGLSDAALAMTQPCIDELIKDISRRVQKAGAITDTAEYQLYRAQALGESKKAIEQAVSKQIGISEEVIANLFEYVADKSLSLDENGSLKRMTEAYTRMTQSKTRELLRDLWADTPEGKVQPLQTAYARAMDFAFRQVATGTLDLNTAIRRAVTPLAKRGLRTIEQKSGRSVGIEYACRRYIMDQLGQLDDEIQHADHDALGCDGWEISAHAACAPDHEPIQGRQYGDAEFEKLNNSLQRRIGHLNCGHTANPIILGVNAPQYTKAQLQKFKDDNERGVVYNGYRYTLYEAGQEQSRIENGIRLIKRQILADEETESPDLQKHQIKLRVVQAEYARFCKAVGLPTRSERLQVAGFGRSQSNRAVWAYKKAAPEQLRDVEIAGHKLYSVTDERIRAVPKPFFQGVSNKVNGLAQEYARGVLKKVQRLEVGTEAVVNFTKDGKCTGYYVGGQNSMKVKPPEVQVPYYSLHNHPSNGILSPEDIQQLIKRPRMQGIGAVGNAGALFTCEKVFGYSQKNAEGWFKALKKKYPLYKGESGKIEDALAQRMIDWLKPILGDGYNEEIDNKIAAEINKGFVAKADYDAAKDAQRTAAEALADANKALAEYKDTDIDGLRKSAEEWQAKQDMTPEKILAMDTTIKAELNKVFGSDVSSVFFGGLSALALADDGAFVFEKVLEAVAPLVEEAHKAGIAAAEARLKKHTAVYADFSKGLAPGQQA